MTRLLDGLDVASKGLNKIVNVEQFDCINLILLISSVFSFQKDNFFLKSAPESLKIYIFGHIVLGSSYCFAVFGVSINYAFVFIQYELESIFINTPELNED